ncbi:uncharacterized protein DS421_5g141040 [Arachis hypogaea]|nr:uncharacterized protein DS421_5g141040 [Arachis hypogaea]
MLIPKLVRDTSQVLDTRQKNYNQSKSESTLDFSLKYFTQPFLLLAFFSMSFFHPFTSQRQYRKIYIETKYKIVKHEGDDE